MMVSSAIVISVQATTIRAANLLASFVVVPVAFLLQGETVLIFWGNEDVLWYAIVAVTLLSGLIVRLGLSHFRREYMLGREIDTLNVKQIGRVFTGRFVGKANSIREWYANELPVTLKELRKPLLIITLLGFAAVVVSYVWVIVNIPAYLDLSPDMADRVKTLVNQNLTGLDDLSQQIPMPILFFHNARAVVIMLMLGLVSFGTLGVTFFLVNMGLVGGVMGGASLLGFSPVLLFAAGILPHGVFELTAVFISTAATLKAGALLVTPQPDKSLGELLLVAIADWFRVFVGIVMPFLAVAAVIEIYITPQLLKLVFPFF
jgi:uncharacterized membrane protein SpoIIM required for sporulation